MTFIFSTVQSLVQYMQSYQRLVYMYMQVLSTWSTAESGGSDSARRLIVDLSPAQPNCQI